MPTILQAHVCVNMAYQCGYSVHYIYISEESSRHEITSTQMYSQITAC